MIQLQGEYSCKIDEKGRFRLPSQLLKQLGTAKESSFFINRGIEKCLTLYPNEVWQKITQEINTLNLYVAQNRQFARYFYRGATELSLDKNERLLLPKTLLEYAVIEHDIVLFAYHNRIEIWSEAAYESVMNEEPDNFSDLAERVMGNAFRN